MLLLITAWNQGLNGGGFVVKSESNPIYLSMCFILTEKSCSWKPKLVRPMSSCYHLTPRYNQLLISNYI